MRNFRHLTRTEIRQIHTGYLSGVPKLQIARELQIDNSTVHYHLNKIKHLPEREIVALFITPCSKCAAGHTSLKCLVCGTASDTMKLEEFQTIRRLRSEVADLKERLASYEKGNTSSPTPPFTPLFL